MPSDPPNPIPSTPSSVEEAANSNSIVVVQPPSAIQKNKYLYPPLVIRNPAKDYLENLFAMAVLVDPVLDSVSGASTLTGDTVASACQATEEGSNFFIFPHLCIPYAGVYRIRVDLYSIDFTGAKLDHFIFTGLIEVYLSSPSISRPSK